MNAVSNLTSSTPTSFEHFETVTTQREPLSQDDHPLKLKASHPTNNLSPLYITSSIPANTRITGFSLDCQCLLPFPFTLKPSLAFKLCSSPSYLEAFATYLRKIRFNAGQAQSKAATHGDHDRWLSISEHPPFHFYFGFPCYSPVCTYLGPCLGQRLYFASQVSFQHMLNLPLVALLDSKSVIVFSVKTYYALHFRCCFQVLNQRTHIHRERRSYVIILYGIQLAPANPTDPAYPMSSHCQSLVPFLSLLYMLVIRLNSPPKAPSPFNAARFNFTVILLSSIDRAALSMIPGDPWSLSPADSAPRARMIESFALLFVLGSPGRLFFD